MATQDVNTRKRLTAMACSLERVVRPGERLWAMLLEPTQTSCALEGKTTDTNHEQAVVWGGTSTARLDHGWAENLSSAIGVDDGKRGNTMLVVADQKLGSVGKQDRLGVPIGVADHQRDRLRTRNGAAIVGSLAPVENRQQHAQN